MPDLWSDVPLIDCDSHVIGPPDLRSTCLPGKRRADAPRVAWNETSRESTWLWQAAEAHPTCSSR
jgi:hypothetical protein